LALLSWQGFLSGILSRQRFLAGISMAQIYSIDMVSGLISVDCFSGYAM